MEAQEGVAAVAWQDPTGIGMLIVTVPMLVCQGHQWKQPAGRLVAGLGSWHHCRFVLMETEESE